MNILSNVSTQIPSIALMVLIIKAIVNLFFAGAVARDAGQITKSGGKTFLVAPMTWAFATLVGGVIVAAIYWFMHHLNISHLKNP